MPVKLLISEYDALEHAIERIRFMLQMFALGEMPDSEPEQVEILARMPEELEARATTRSAFVAPPDASITTAPISELLNDSTKVSPNHGAAQSVEPDGVLHAAPVLPEIGHGLVQREEYLSVADVPFEEPVYTPEVVQIGREHV